MSRKRKELPVLEQIEITDVAAEGKALVRIDDMVVFVPWVVPGDVVDLKIRKKKHHYAEAEAVRFHKYSPQRTAPFCPHFTVCGGCKWQMLPYEEQLRWKQKQVMDALERIGKVELPECQPILGSQKTREYRNKVEFGCANKVWLTWEQMRADAPVHSSQFAVHSSQCTVHSAEEEENSELCTVNSALPNAPQGAIGYHAGGAFDKILPIEVCRLMDDENNRLRNDIRDYALGHGLSFHDQREHTGLLKGIMIRLGNTGGVMLLVQFCILTDEEHQQAMGLMEHLRETHPEVTSLLWVNNTKWNDTFGDLPVQVYAGQDHIFLEMEGLRFKVGPKSFYQTNTEQAYILYKVVRDFALGESTVHNSQFTVHSSEAENHALCTVNRLEAKPLVYDLYTGTGTIANFVARGARQVVGIEYVPEAIEDARVNSEINGITNTCFYAGDMKDVLSDDFIARHGRPDIIITDPPRAGMHPDVVQTILRAAPGRIVYVSCNPATQARDLQMLDQAYCVTRVQPVDMFPHTQHVENVVLLERREG